MVLLIILHTKSKAQLKHILPTSESKWRISLSPRHIQKKEELSLLSLLSHKDLNTTLNTLIYKRKITTLSETLSKFSLCCLSVSIYFRDYEAGEASDEGGGAIPAPLPSLLKYKVLACTHTKVQLRACSLFVFAVISTFGLRY